MPQIPNTRNGFLKTFFSLISEICGILGIVISSSIVLLLTSNHFFTPAFSQDLSFARTVIGALCSPAMHGRGYVNGGDDSAAAYIARQFVEVGLKPFGTNYFQPFEMAVNTFPGKMEVKINKKMLYPGAAYIVSPYSSGCSGKYKLFPLTKITGAGQERIEKYKKSDFSRHFFVIEQTGMERDKQEEHIHAAAQLFSPRGILFLRNDKLTWGVSRSVRPYTVIEAVRDSIPSSAKRMILNIENTFIQRDSAVNVIGYTEGMVPDTFILFTAHYDHLGRMGAHVFFPGANDNAGGVAMLLDISRHYASLLERPKYSIAFIAFAAEEAGLLGSKFFTENPLFPLKAIKFLINLDLVGNGEDGAVAVNGEVFPRQFAALDSINREKQYLPNIGKRGKAQNSDHYWFTEKGVPSFFIYTTGKSKVYHDIYDTPENLSFAEYEDLFRLLTEFAGWLQ